MGSFMGSKSDSEILNRWWSAMAGSATVHLGQVGGRYVSAAATFARPLTEASPYAAKDAVSNSATAATIVTFSNLGRVDQGSGYITKARLLTDQVTCTSRFRLQIFNAAVSAVNDNAPQSLLWTNAPQRVGFIDYPAMQTEGTGTAANALLTPGVGNLPVGFVCAAADRNLYGMLETLDAFTAATGQQFYLVLGAEQN